MNSNPVQSWKGDSFLQVKDLFESEAKFKINSIIHNLYKIPVSELEEALVIPSQAFLVNYYLNLSLEVTGDFQKTIELTEFINQISLVSLRRLWTCEGCSLSIKISRNRDYRSYFFYVEEKKIIQLLFLFHEEARDCQDQEAIIRKTRKRLFNLIPLLSNETIQGLHEYSFLEDLTTRLEEILTLDEIRTYAQIRPDLFTKIEFSSDHPDLNYTKTLMTQGIVEWEEAYQLLEMERNHAWENRNSEVVPENFLFRKGEMFFRLDYLLSIIRLFRNEQREFALRKLLNSNLKKNILTVDKEILPILAKRDS